MLSGQFVSNIGGWMQTVAAQWLMLTLTTLATQPARRRSRPPIPGSFRLLMW
jgi:hypothetical protein